MAFTFATKFSWKTHNKALKNIGEIKKLNSQPQLNHELIHVNIGNVDVFLLFKLLSH